MGVAGFTRSGCFCVPLFHLCRGAPKKPLGFRAPVDNVGRTLPPPALRQVWGLCKNRVRSFAQLNRRYICSRYFKRVGAIMPLLNIFGYRRFNLDFRTCGSWGRFVFEVRVFFAPSAQRGRRPHALRAPLPKGSSPLTSARG